MAFIIIDQINTCGVVFTRHRQTFVEVQVTSFSGITGLAITLETTFEIDANAVIANLVIGSLAFVYIVFA